MLPLRRATIVDKAGALDFDGLVHSVQVACQEKRIDKDQRSAYMKQLRELEKAVKEYKEATTPVEKTKAPTKPKKKPSKRMERRYVITHFDDRKALTATSTFEDALLEGQKILDASPRIGRLYIWDTMAKAYQAYKILLSDGATDRDPSLAYYRPTAWRELENAEEFKALLNLEEPDKEK